jgi:cytochrome P450
MHDPAVHHDPSEFKPERYTKPYNEPNPADIAFGFGRRACPGRYIAEQTLFLTIAQTLAVFKIHKAVDSTGKEIDVQYKQLPGLISRVSPFQYQLTARSDKCRTLVD